MVRQRPPNYDPRTHREKWENADWKLDGKLMVNFDEIPYSIDWDTKQLVAAGERISLNRTAFDRLKKYREGTIGMFMTPFEVLMIVIIYRKAGGPQVRERLRTLEQTDNSNVFMLGTEKGTMNAEMWPKCLKALAECTKERRGTVEEHGEDWKYAIALYVDSFAVHLNRQVALDTALRYGIFIRPLLRNASHLMQPVDRNVGICFKNKYKSRLLQYNYDFLHMLSLNIEFTVSVEKYTQMCTGALNTVFLQVYCTLYHFVPFLHSICTILYHFASMGHIRGTICR